MQIGHVGTRGYKASKELNGPPWYDVSGFLTVTSCPTVGSLIVLINPPTLAQTSCRLLILVRSNGIHVVGERSPPCESVVVTMNAKTSHKCISTIKCSIA
jgi:hypothetical protein